MDRDQHITQDAAEHYAVYVMADTAFRLGVATTSQCEELWDSFRAYLSGSGWTIADFTEKYPKYKKNVDSQVPRFIDRLSSFFPASTFSFVIDEAAFRNRGLKADFVLEISNQETPHFISLKNYIGAGGIQRPQVSSGTLFSFASGFVFERVGVGTFVDPRTPGAKFAARNKRVRDAVLESMELSALIDPLQELQDLSRYVKDQLLTPELEMYDGSRVKEVVAVVSKSGREAILEVFRQLGPEVVRTKFLERAGLDGTEEVLYFDSSKFLDSLTQPGYRDLRLAINHPQTEFHVSARGKGLRFEFLRDGASLLAVSVPLTVNTNGAWFRPKQRFEGTQMVKDVRGEVELVWGQRRPKKSKQIDTSTNTYLDLRRAGVLAI